MFASSSAPFKRPRSVPTIVKESEEAEARMGGEVGEGPHEPKDPPKRAIEGRRPPPALNLAVEKEDGTAAQGQLKVTSASAPVRDGGTIECRAEPEKKAPLGNSLCPRGIRVKGAATETAQVSAGKNYALSSELRKSLAVSPSKPETMSVIGLTEVKEDPFPPPPLSTSTSSTLPANKTKIPWTKADDATLRILVQRGEEWDGIAQVLGREEKKCRKRWREKREVWDKEGLLNPATQGAAFSASSTSPSFPVPAAASGSTSTGSPAPSAEAVSSSLSRPGPPPSDDLKKSVARPPTSLPVPEPAPSSALSASTPTAGTAKPLLPSTAAALPSSPLPLALPQRLLPPQPAPRPRQHSHPRPKPPSFGPLIANVRRAMRKCVDELAQKGEEEEEEEQ